MRHARCAWTDHASEMPTAERLRVPIDDRAKLQQSCLGFGAGNRQRRPVPRQDSGVLVRAAMEMSRPSRNPKRSGEREARGERTADGKRGGNADGRDRRAAGWAVAPKTNVTESGRSSEVEAVVKRARARGRRGKWTRRSGRGRWRRRNRFGSGRPLWLDWSGHGGRVCIRTARLRRGTVRHGHEWKEQDRVSVKAGHSLENAAI
jgi:hypothetical protein